MHRTIHIFIVLFNFLFVSPVYSQWNRVTTLTPDSEGGYYGVSLDLNDSTVVIGQPANKKVYVYEKVDDLWIETQVILSPNDFQDAFGSSVSISVNTLLIGAKQDNTTAYIYEKRNNLWEISAYLEGRTDEWGDSFGHSVKVHKDYAVVSSKILGRFYFYHNIDGVWEGINLFQIENIETNNGSYSPAYSEIYDSEYWIDISDDIIVLGDPTSRGGTGAAYIFEKKDNEWVKTDSLSTYPFEDMVTPRLNFGQSVNIINETQILIGSGYDMWAGEFTEDVRESYSFIYKKENDRWVKSATFEFKNNTYSLITASSPSGKWVTIPVSLYSHANVLFKQTNNEIWSQIQNLPPGRIRIANSTLIIQNGSGVELYEKDPNEVITRSAKKVNSSTLFRIYPVPSNGRLMISISKPQKSNIKIYDLRGNLLLNKENITNSTLNLDLNFLANGIYVIELKTEKEIEQKRFVLE